LLLVVGVVIVVSVIAFVAIIVGVIFLVLCMVRRAANKRSLFMFVFLVVIPGACAENGGPDNAGPSN